MFHCLPLQRNSLGLLTGNGSSTSSFCLYFSYSVSLRETIIHCCFGGQFACGKISVSLVWISFIYLFFCLYRFNCFWHGCCFGLDACCLFPQCVLAIIPLIGSGQVHGPCVLLGRWGEWLAPSTSTCLWSLKCQWWLCLTMELVQVVPCCLRVLPQKRKPLRLCTSKQWGLACLVGSGSFWHATPLVGVHHTLAPSGCLYTTSPHILLGSDLQDSSLSSQPPPIPADEHLRLGRAGQ